MQRAQPALTVLCSGATAWHNGDEGWDDVRSARPFCLGLHTRHNGWYKGWQESNLQLILKAILSSECRLKPVWVKGELLGTAGQNNVVNTFSGLVHTARHVMKAGNT